MASPAPPKHHDGSPRPPLWKCLLRAFGTHVYHFFLLAVFLYQLLGVAPVYTALFTEMEVALPPATQLVVTTAESAASYGYLMVPLYILIDVPLVLLLAIGAGRHRWALSAYSMVWTIGLILWLSFSMLVLSLPVVHLVRALS